MRSDWEFLGDLAMLSVVGLFIGEGIVITGVVMWVVWDWLRGRK